MTASEERSMAVKKLEKRTKSILRTPADIRKAWHQLEQEIAKHKADSKDTRETYAAMTRAEFEAKLKRVNSPMIVSHGWTASAAPGGTITYRLLIVNYDILPATSLA